MGQPRIIVADQGAAEPISAGAALLAGKKVAPDASRLLEMDHLEAMAFFERFDLAPNADEKLDVARRLCLLLDAHMRVEEELFYPAAEEATGDEALVDHARAEHEEARGFIAQLRGQGAIDEAYLVAMTELRRAISHHVMDEENEFFPRVRKTGLDLYELGRRVAARRVELVSQTTGRTPREGQMQSNDNQAGETRRTSELDVGRTQPFGDAALQAVEPEEARELFRVGLRNAHALEQNCRTMVQRQLDRLESYPKLKARLTQHLAETEAQIERLERILGDVDDSPSGFKDFAMSMTANMGAMANAMAGDEVLKNSMASASAAQMEIAAYRSLLVMGEAAGAEPASLRLLQQSLSEERAMAAWLEENLPGTVISFLQHRSEDRLAKH